MYGIEKKIFFFARKTEQWVRIYRWDMGMCIYKYMKQRNKMTTFLIRESHTSNARRTTTATKFVKCYHRFYFFRHVSFSRFVCVRACVDVCVYGYVCMDGNVCDGMWVCQVLAAVSVSVVCSKCVRLAILCCYCCCWYLCCCSCMRMCVYNPGIFSLPLYLLLTLFSLHQNTCIAIFASLSLYPSLYLSLSIPSYLKKTYLNLMNQQRIIMSTSIYLLTTDSLNVCDTFESEKRENKCVIHALIHARTQARMHRYTHVYLSLGRL